MHGTNGQSDRIDKLVAQYIALRTHIAEVEAAQEEHLKPAKALKDQVAGMMLEFLEKTGQQNAKTKNGTVYIRVEDSTSVSDGEAFMNYVLTNEAYELLNRSANKTACKEFVEKNGALPPGVQYNSKRNVGVRK